MTYILIWLIYYGHGMTSGTQKFDGSRACDKASKEFKAGIKLANPDARTVLICTPQAVYE